MPQQMKDIVLLGKETTRGTAAGTLPLHQPFVGDGLVPEITNHLGEILSSSGWPYVTDQVPVGVTASVQLAPEVNINTIRDIILMSKRDGSGNLPSLTIAHSQAGVGDAHYLGSVNSELGLEFSRSGSPDASAVLAATMSFGCMKTASTTGVSAGTQGTGRKFQLRHSTFEINSVAASKVLSCRLRVTNDLDEGAPDENNMRLWIEEGLARFEVVVVAQFLAQAWGDLVRQSTEHDAEFILKTGTATEDVTATINKAQAGKRNLGKEGGTLTEEITLSPGHDGTNPAIIWAFGAGIGASQLGLS